MNVMSSGEMREEEKGIFKLFNTVPLLRTSAFLETSVCEKESSIR